MSLTGRIYQSICKCPEDCALHPNLNKPCGCKVSTGICGCLTYGTGRLSEDGWWEIACPHGREVHTC